MTPEEKMMEKMMGEYLSAVLDALVEKSRSFHENGQDNKEKFLRMTEIKNAIKSIGSPHTFGVAQPSYSSCPGECVGGVCVGALGIKDKDLDDLATALGVTPQELSRAGG